MERQKCIVCDKSIFFLYQIDLMPIILSQTYNKIDDDVFQDQQVYYCKHCSCVQLKNLIDPSILYQHPHNTTSALPTWKEHHATFSKFITESLDTNAIMEIGGSSGALYQHLKNEPIEYSCIDLCEANFDTSNCTYIIGNAEEYNYDNVDTVAMSHVFEHLYDPKLLLSNLSKNNISTIFISIPNMSALLNRRSSSIIHYEHTYYIDKYFTEYLLSEQGYSLTKYVEFKDHSLCMQFKKTNCEKQVIEPRHNIVEQIHDIYNSMYTRFQGQEISPTSYIIPAGHMGQLFYSIAKPSSIYGFLDNDPSKQGKRLYGTPYMIYPFDQLKRHSETIDVYIYAGPYLKEVVKQLEQYSNIRMTIL
jgi:2-polyprenyl-3-methyl-5-hydroxy-6-metoxy-1,4-benzoquinol methylase